jgi:choline-sulfatase
VAMRGFPLLCVLVVMASLVASAQQKKMPAAVPRKSAQPDIFLVTIDTLRADHVHCYGDEQIETPALDSLAKDSARFTHAFTPSPITNTSHTSILTGLLPSSHGVTDFGIPLAADHATWAELLKAKGYHTAAFIGAVILDSNSLAPGLNRGFDFYDNFPEHPQTKERWGRVERRGADVAQHAEKWLDAHTAGPHFVWVHLYDPHDPYEPPAPFSDKYKDRLYDGEIAYADSVLGNFIAYLKQHGWYDNAMIVVTGDHGEGLGEHQEETHGIFLYDATTHVPLIVKLPGKTAAAKVVDAQVRTIDIMPTALDAAHVAIPDTLDGKSLKSYIAGTASDDRTAIGQTDYPLRFGWAPVRSVRAEGFKFIKSPKPEFYDLHSDAGELKNIYDPDNATLGKLRDELAQVKDSTVTDGDALPDPKDHIVEQNLLHTAMMASDDNRPADARTALEKALQLDAKSPTALRQLGELEMSAGNYAKAADYLKRAREVRPDDSTAAFEEGQSRQKSGDFAGARDALESSLKLMPGQLPARVLLGQVYLGLKDPKAAEDQFEAALLVDSKNVDATLGLASAQITQGNFADAITQLEPLAQSQADNPAVFEALAQAYNAAGKQAEAQKAESRAKVLREKTAKP